jgi:hypothetical protein
MPIDVLVKCLLLTLRKDALLCEASMYDAKQFSEIRRRSRRSLDNALSGNAPDKLKLLAYQLSSSSRVHHDLEWCWIAQTELARRLGVAERTVRKYIRALELIGAYKVETMAPGDLSRLLVARYGRGLPAKIKTKKRINGYTVLWEHDLWRSGTLSEGDLRTIREVIRNFGGLSKTGTVGSGSKR